MMEADNPCSHTPDIAFPPELYDCILEMVVDRQTLANCALVDRTLGRRAQALLFQTIFLYTSQHSRFLAFLELLTDSPYIPPLIRELSIYGLAAQRPEQPNFDSDIGFIISCAVNLTHLTLQFHTLLSEPRRDLPTFLTTTVRAALRQLPRLYAVEFLDGEGCLTQNVLDMLRACDGSTAGKIVVVDYDGRFAAHPSAADNSLSFPNVTEIEFIAHELDASFVHPWLSRPFNIFPRLRVMTVGVSESRGVNDLHHNVLLPNGLRGLRCLKVVWLASRPIYYYLQTQRSEPNSATEESMPMLAIGFFPEVILEYRFDVYNDIAILWWCRIFGNLEVSVIETLSLIVYIAAEDLTNLESWAKLDGILSSWRFRSLKELTVQFWVAPPETAAERRNFDGRVELSRLEFPQVSKKAKMHILIESSPTAQFW